MGIVSKKEFLASKNRYLQKISEGAVFIYPTDTIYGIGCDATNLQAVKRIRQIKKRDDKPFSVAVPSKKWIIENCKTSSVIKKWLKKLPGPYTFLLQLKNKKAIASQVTPTNILGVRIPNNWFAKIVTKVGVPIVSTSANTTKKAHMTSLKDLNPEVAKKVDFIVYEGEKNGNPSTIVNLFAKNVELIKRGKVK